MVRQAVGPIAVPAGAGGDDDLFRAISERRRGSHRLLSEHHLRLFVLLDELADLQLAVVAMKPPLPQPGERGDLVQMAADLRRRVVQMHGVAALPQPPRALGSRGSGSAP